jgi:hypothetical protein
MEIGSAGYITSLVGGEAPSAATAGKEFEALFFNALLKASGAFQGNGMGSAGAIWDEFFVQHLALLMADQYDAGVETSVNDVLKGEA